jgi:predicted permease
VLVSIAIAISVALTFFEILNALVFKSLPVRSPSDLVLLAQDDSAQFTTPAWEEMSARQHSFEGMFAWFPVRFDLSPGGESQFVNGLYVTGDYFQVLGVKPGIGRLLTSDNDIPGSRTASEVVISHGFWSSRYGGAPDVLGRALVIQGHPFTIVGVVEQGFVGLNVGQTFDVAVPLAAEAILAGGGSRLHDRGIWWLNVMGRLRPGVAVQDAERDLNASRHQIREATLPSGWPAEDLAQYMRGPFVLTPGARGLSEVRDSYFTPLIALNAVTALLLLLAYVSVATLMLARTLARRAELGIRMALGATRWHVVRELTLEVLLLSSAGSVSGLLLAWWSAPLATNLMSTRFGAVILPMSLDWRVAAFLCGSIAISTIVLGAGRTLPVSGTGLRVSQAMRAAPATDRTRSGGAVAFLTVQIAIAFAVIVVAQLFVRTFVNLLVLNPGFDTRALAAVAVDFQRSSVKVDARGTEIQEMLSALSHDPEIESAAASTLIPLGGASWAGNVRLARASGLAYFNRVSDSYFDTLHIPMLGGRSFGAGDTLNGPALAVVNRAFVDKFCGSASALGNTFQYNVPNSPKFQIVGIVGNAKYHSLREDDVPAVYLSVRQDPHPPASIVLLTRFKADVSRDRLKRVARVLASVDSKATVNARSLDRVLGQSVQEQRMLGFVGGILGAVALIVGCLGTIGVVLEVINRRKIELSLRAALGAPRWTLVRQSLSHILASILCGSGVGVLLGLAGGRLVNALLFRAAPLDWYSCVISMGAFACVVAVGAAVAMLRTTAADAVVCLRSSCSLRKEAR